MAREWEGPRPGPVSATAPGCLVHTHHVEQLTCATYTRHVHPRTHTAVHAWPLAGGPPSSRQVDASAGRGADTQSHWPLSPRGAGPGCARAGPAGGTAGRRSVHTAFCLQGAGCPAPATSCCRRSARPPRPRDKGPFIPTSPPPLHWPSLRGSSRPGESVPSGRAVLRGLSDSGSWLGTLAAACSHVTTLRGSHGRSGAWRRLCPWCLSPGQWGAGWSSLGL